MHHHAAAEMRRSAIDGRERTQIVPDKYKSFEELKRAEPPGSYVIVPRRRDSTVVVVAPHGGGIEPGTSEIAHAIAGEEFSYYLFEGHKPTGNRDLHITSSRFNEPQAFALTSSARFVLTVHGEATKDAIVYVGGLDVEVKRGLSDALQASGYFVREHANVALRGQDKLNICNAGTTGLGVQLELSFGLRRSFFASLTREGRAHPTDRLAPFAATIRGVLLNRFRVATEVPGDPPS
jgi:phage replication-related protein YjqB (UPF0714/DUF867 family)